MKKLIEILDEQSEKRHPSDSSYYNDGDENDNKDVFDGSFSHVKEASNEYALQFVDAIRKQVDTQCGNEYGTLTFIDEITNPLRKK